MGITRGPEDADYAVVIRWMAMNCSNNSSFCVCVVVKAVRPQPALLNDQLCCFLSQPGEFWQHLPRAARRGWQKSAYRDGRVRYHLLITGGFSGVFITCVDQGCVSSWVYMWVGYCYTGWTAGGQLVCVCVSRGSCFSSAVGSLQYSWALWGSVCRAALRLSLSNCPIKQLLMCLWVVQTTISAFPPKDLLSPRTFLKPGMKTFIHPLSCFSFCFFCLMIGCCQLGRLCWYPIAVFSTCSESSFTCSLVLHLIIGLCSQLSCVPWGITVGGWKRWVHLANDKYSALQPLSQSSWSSVKGLFLGGEKPTQNYI